MFNSFDKMFDLNHDGNLDWGERAVQFQFMEEMEKKEHENKTRKSFWDKDDDNEDE